MKIFTADKLCSVIVTDDAGHVLVRLL